MQCHSGLVKPFLGCFQSAVIGMRVVSSYVVGPGSSNWQLPLQTAALSVECAIHCNGV
jgi:hypothetical protein